ncbi:MAG: efflux RND transporter periplasmic adaptor subunit [Deltaproteobacteria bacterium]|nr:efflux RND transporter periplasmic adaptor subunit [Deltaproteobacteria bacterium]
MWRNLPGRIRRPALVGLLVAGLLALAAVPLPGQEGAGSQGSHKEAAAGRLAFTAKVFCSLKRSVPLPFAGVITAVAVRVGDKVEPGEVLARYRLAPEARLELHRRLSPPQLKELAAQLAEVESRRVAMQAKLDSSRRLAEHQLASPQALRLLEKQYQQLLKQRRALAGNLAALRRLAREEAAVLQEQLGTPVNPSRLPAEGVLRSPLEGHVIWVHPDLKEGAYLEATPAVFRVGVLDPVVLRAKVHEIEAMQLRVGDEAEVTLNSLPGQKFTARLTRLPWTTSATALEQPSYFDVEFIAANPGLVLKEGLTAQLVMDKSP